MSLTLMNIELMKILLSGQEDCLSPLVDQDNTFYASKVCPTCGGSCRKVFDTKTGFREGELLPRYLLKCLACESTFDPRTNLILTMGNLAKAVEPAIPIIKAKPDSGSK
jgi:hypothetical protein